MSPKPLKPSMINAIPILGWLISIFISFSLSVPFYLAYNHVAPKYFAFLPEAYHFIPFWDCFCLFIVFSILRGVLFPIQINNSK